MMKDKVTEDVLSYSLTSTAWTGEIYVTYNSLGLLTNIDLSRAELSEKQHVAFLRNIPREFFELQKMVDSRDTLTLTQIQQEVTFDDFWNKYDEKARSSKKKSEMRWNKLNRHNQQRAFRHIDKYMHDLPAWQTKKIAETYLNSEIWNN